MTRSLIPILIRKDWDLSRNPVLGFVMLSAIGFCIIILGNTQLTFIIGGVLLITALIILGAFLVQAIVASERKEMTLPFIMSLPVTIMQYTWAKLWLCLAAYLVPWCLVVAAAFILVLTSAIPDGMLALCLPLFGAILGCFLITLAVAIVTESPQATVIVLTCCNVGINFFIFAIVRLPGIGSQFESPAFDWVPALTWLMTGEALFAAACIGSTIHFQSRKTDFI